MAVDRYDVVVIGSGFSGSLLAYVLASHGKSVALIDARNHPRFSIGESSTPIADLLLDRLVRDFGLSDLASLSRYGSWKRDFPDLVCGKKRGFSYFRHRADQPFTDSECHPNSILVTASRDDEVADTHWLRSDVDQHFFQLAKNAGATSLLAKVVDIEELDAVWRVMVEQTDLNAVKQLHCDFLVDASGRDGISQTRLGIDDQSRQLHTNTRTTYGHFANVGSWQRWLETRDFPVEDYPFDADDAAQHHIFDDGWLWMLRFDNDVTSVGWTRRNIEESTAVPNADCMRALNLHSYPSLRELFASAEHVTPGGALRTSGRLQRLANRMVGRKFALMPTAGVTIDPLHSSGIAHGLAGVYRLAKILLETSPTRGQRQELLGRYERDVQREAVLLDRLVAGCYDACRSAGEGGFELFKAHSMCYFLGAIASEEALARGVEPSILWNAADSHFVGLVIESHRRVLGMAGGQFLAADIESHWAWAQEVLSPWNQAGLLDPAARNMYRYTAAPK